MNSNQLFQTMQDRLEDREYSRFRKGIGRYALCERCNNLTGAWYGKAFANWTKQGFDWFDKLKTASIISLPYYIQPLNVLKQVLSMALAMSAEASITYHRDLLRIPGHRGQSFRFIVGTHSGTIVGSDSGSSWAPIPVQHEQLERLMLEQLHTGQTSWPPLSLREETNIDVSPEGLHASGQRSLTFNGCGP